MSNNNYSNEDIYNQETFYNNNLNNNYNNNLNNYYNNNYIVNEYLNFINNYIHTMNRNINYFNESNTIIRNMSNELNNMHRNLDYYYYNLYRNNNIAYSRDYREYYNNLNLNLNNNQEEANNEEANEEANNEQANNEQANEEANNQEENNEEEANETYQYLNTLNPRDEENYKILSNENIDKLISDNVSFKKFNEIGNPLNDTCPISQDDLEADDDISIINHCGHIFKREPLENWLKQNHSCPSCRYNILLNSNIIKYKIGSNCYYLTTNQSRIFIATNIMNAMLNNNSSNVSFSIIRR